MPDNEQPRNAVSATGAPADTAPGAAQDTRLRRLRMRAWRRGTREMDLILGPFADTAMPGLSASDLDTFEALLEENDHDLYRWISARLTVAGRSGTMAAPGDNGLGQAAAPGDSRAALLDTIAAHAGSRLRSAG